MSVNRQTTKSRRLLSSLIQTSLLETSSESEGSVADIIDEGTSSVEPEVQVDSDTTIPSVTLPPGIEVSSYSAIVRHLKQSKFLFDAFHEKFGKTRVV